MNKKTLTIRCKIHRNCQYRDTSKCVDVTIGCMLYGKDSKEDAENP